MLSMEWYVYTQFTKHYPLAQDLLNKIEKDMELCM